MSDKRAFEALLDECINAYLGNYPTAGEAMSAGTQARAAVLQAYDAAKQPAPFKPTGDPSLDAVLLKPDPAFDALIASLPDNYWARYDLSAVRIGWHFGRAAAGREGQPVRFASCACEKKDGVYWNEFNGVVQCHRCGEFYTTTRTHPAPKDDAAADWVNQIHEALETLSGIPVYCSWEDSMKFAKLKGQAIQAIYDAIKTLAASPARVGEGDK